MASAFWWRWHLLCTGIGWFEAVRGVSKSAFVHSAWGAVHAKRRAKEGRVGELGIHLCRGGALRGAVMAPALMLVRITVHEVQVIPWQRRMRGE